MTASAARLVGTDWEDWANRLLSHHFGPTNYQRVPSKDRGDAGLEGFCISGREAFQCYGCEEPIGVQERYNKQRVKMTTDVNKFINNTATLQKLFAPSLKMRRWVLFVPIFDSKEIVAHAAKKTKDVLAAALPYVDPDFRVVVVQESSFSVARDQLLSTTPQSLKFLQTPISDADIGAWSASNDGLVGVLRSKLSNLPTLQSGTKTDEFTLKVLGWYLAGQELLESLRDYPEVYEKVIATKSHREDFLARAWREGAAANGSLTVVLRDFAKELTSEASELHNFSAQKLAAEAVADWLMRCPLSFPEATNG